MCTTVEGWLTAPWERVALAVSGVVRSHEVDARTTSSPVPLVNVAAGTTEAEMTGRANESGAVTSPKSSWTPTVHATSPQSMNVPEPDPITRKTCISMENDPAPSTELTLSVSHCAPELAP